MQNGLVSVRPEQGKGRKSADGLTTRRDLDRRRKKTGRLTVGLKNLEVRDSLQHLVSEFRSERSFKTQTKGREISVRVEEKIEELN